VAKAADFLEHLIKNSVWTNQTIPADKIEHLKKKD